MQPENIGVNEILYNWAKNSQLIRTAIGPDNSSLNTTLSSFFGENEEKRKTAGIELYKKIWGAHSIFGPLPFFDLLMKFEHDRVFYSNYRDHTIHALNVCFLGLYIYENTVAIRDAISKHFIKMGISNGNYTNDELFVYTWLLTSLYHDLGYLVENVKINCSNAVELNEFLEEINKTLHTPLACTPFFISKKITTAKENRFINESEVFVPSFTSIDQVETPEFFAFLKRGSEYSHLATNGENGVEKYYAFAKSHMSKDRSESFRDHGIYSALLLLFSWDSFHKYIDTICSKEKFDTYYSNTKEDILQIKSQLDFFDTLITIAAQAISLHNINKTIWNDSDSTNNGITLQEFKIGLNDETTALPFAFLLRLCDELQVWDRPRFRVPSPSDKNIYSDELSIIGFDNGVFIRCFPDEARFIHPDTDEDSFYCTLRKRLEQYLDADDISSFLQYDLFRRGAEKKQDNYYNINSSQKDCIESILQYFCDITENTLHLRTKIEAVIVVWTDKHIKRRTFYSCNKPKGAYPHNTRDYSFGVVGMLQEVLKENDKLTDCILIYDHEKNPITCEYNFDSRTPDTEEREVEEQRWDNKGTKAMLAISLFRQNGDIPQVFGALTFDFAESIKDKGNKQKASLFYSVRRCRDILVPLLVTDIKTDYGDQLKLLEKEEEK